jgi:hypothetical protein
MGYVTAGHRRRADAILIRRTDRLPFAASSDSFATLLRSRLDDTDEQVDFINEQDRAQLAEACQLTDALRLYDSAYHAELNWWTAPFAVSDGIPHSSLVSAAESDRVAVGRTFPVIHTAERRLQVPEDRSIILVISALADTRRDILKCGETLSKVLLEATLVGMASCPLTHLTEVPASREIVSRLTGRPLPQVLVRIGVAPALEVSPPPTARRSLSDVLQNRRLAPH